MYIYLNGLAQPTGPLPQPVIPDKNPEPMPTQPLEPQYCQELNKVQSNVCFDYAPSEIAISRTAAGHLTPDVILTQPVAPLPYQVVSCGYLIIRDFGVDWRHVKLATRSEQLFKDMLNRFETDQTLHFFILGYSDCVGAEKNNFLLRLGRARNISRLLGPKAQKRVLSVTAAPATTYLTSNSTVASRAHNRAVVIEFFTGGSQVV